MKRRIVWLTLVVAVFAAGVSFGTGKAEGPGAAEQRTLTVWSHKEAGQNNWTKEVVKRYMEANPNIKVEYTIFEEIAGYNTKLVTAISGGGGPDVFDINTETAGAYYPRGMLAPIDLTVAGYRTVDEYAQKWAPGALDGFKSKDGRLLGTPYALDVWQMFVNKKHFAAAGVNHVADAPATWNDFYRLCERLHQKDSSNNTVVKGYQLPFGGPFGWYLIIWSPMLWQNGGRIFDDNQMSAIDSPATRKAIEIWNDIYTKYDTGCAADYPGANPVFEFGQGGSATTIAGPWAIGTVKAISSEVFESIDIIPLPQVDPNNPTVVFNAWGWFLNANSPNGVEAAKWIVYYSDLALEGYLAGVGFPPRKEVVDSPQAKQMLGYDVFVKGLSHARSREGTPYYDETGNAIKAALDQIVLLGRDPDPVIRSLHAEINKIQSGN